MGDRLPERSSMLHEIQVSHCNEEHGGCNSFLLTSTLPHTHTHTHTHTSRELLAGDDRFAVPAIIPELSTKRVLTAELIHGMPLDHCTHLPQDVKNEASQHLVT